MSKSKDRRMSQEAEFDVGYPTGYLVFDFLNGVKVYVQPRDGKESYTYDSVGIVDGTMVSVVGRSGCGKTTFVIQAAGNIIRPFENGAIFHEDIEGGINNMRMRQLLKMTEEDFKTKYVRRNTGITTETFLKRVKWIHDEKIANVSSYEYDTGLYDSAGERIFKLQPTVVILDSLAMLMPEDLTEEGEISSNMAVTSIAKKNTNLIKQIIPMLKTANIIFFVINHLLPDPSIMPKKAQVAWLRQGERCPGGESAIYSANNLLRFDDSTKLKADKDFGISGIIVDIELCKSRTNAPGRKATLVFDYATGFDPELSLYLLLKQTNRINGAGAYLFVGDRDDMKFAQKNIKTMLRDNEEFRNIFIQECFSALDELINSYAMMALKEAEDTSIVDVSSMMINMMRQNVA